jgi:hypothetical protein
VCDLPTGEFVSKMVQQGRKRDSSDEVEVYMNGLLISLECAWTYAVGKSEKNFVISVLIIWLLYDYHLGSKV